MGRMEADEMKGKMIFAFALMAVALGGLAFAAPLLQVTNYTTVPTDVYPGTFGYLQISLTNKGDVTAQSVSAQYSIDGISRAVSLGDIGSGSSAQVSVPFMISRQAAGSIQLLDVNVYYNGQAAASSSISSLKTSISVPLMVKQYKPLEVRTLSIGNSAIAQGEKTSFVLSLTNNGGVVNSLLITTPDNSTFSIDGATQKSVGSMKQNSTMNVSITLASTSDTKTGTYNVPLVFTYLDALNQPNSETLYVGPISVLDSSSQYRLDLVPLATVEIGSQIPFDLVLQNNGKSAASGILVINSTSVFTPIGAQRIYFDNVAPGATLHKNITVGVGASISAGYYTLPLVLTASTGQEMAYGIGIQVEATPEITVTLDSTGSTPLVQVANTGNSQIRSVYASAKTTGAQTATESFMGTLNVDDFASLSLDSSASGGGVEVEIRFRDSNNIEHSVKKTLTAAAGNSSFVQGVRSQAGGTAASTAGNFAGRNSNPLGFLLGPGGRSASGTTDGIGIVPMAIGAVVVIGAGYLVYRKYFAKKKAAPAAAKQEGHAKSK
jgi:hypothetical protein